MCNIKLETKVIANSDAPSVPQTRNNMQYRTLTRDKLKVSALGFGCMRLPTLKSGKVDQEEAVRMLRHGIDSGINYIDTAAPYHDGDSEKVVGKALKDGYRDKVLIADKFPTWEATKKSDLDRIFNEQIAKLGVDCIDVYLLHCLHKRLMDSVKKFEMIDWIVKKREQGKIRYLGFSFHDDLPLFREIVDMFDWDVCQIQYNYVNETTQAGTEGLKYAAKKGLSTIIMEPLFGGALANPVGKLAGVFKKHKENSVDLALRWLWDKPEVALVLSGMSNMEQTVQNLEIAGRSGVETFTGKEQTVIAEAQKVYGESLPIPCTKCGYCLPCPFDVDIPSNFELYNSMSAMPETASLMKNIYAMFNSNRQASHCTECGQCEQKCPQHLTIPQFLKQVDKALRG